MELLKVFVIIVLFVLNYLCYLALLETDTLTTIHKYRKHAVLFFIVSAPFGFLIFTLWMALRHRKDIP